MPEKENFKLALSDEMDYDKRHGKTKIFPNTEQVPDKAGREEENEDQDKVCAQPYREDACGKSAICIVRVFDCKA